MTPDLLPLHAGFWRRCGASFIDAAILTLPALALAPFLTGAWERIGWIEAIATGWLYYGLLHASKWQATPGKRLIGIKVTDTGGQRISFLRSTGRYFASLVSAIILGIGYLMAAFTRERRALHDYMAGTVVVRAQASAEEVSAGGRGEPLAGRTRWAIAAAIVFGGAWSAGVSWWSFDRALAEARPEAVMQSLPVGIDQTEELMFSLYRRPLFGSEPELVQKGVRKYERSEVRVMPGPTKGGHGKVYTLPVVEDFSIHAHIYREPRIDGFGLTLERGLGGFSWEWFSREEGNVFRKLQEGGRVSVRMRQFPEGMELAEIRVLEDITLRMDRYAFIPFTGRDSDRLTLRKGSVLWLSP